MTLHETCKQLHSLSVNGYFNGEKFTISRLENYVKSMFRGNLAGGNKLMMQIALPDGLWYFFITNYAKNEFDYTIPDTRDQERRLWIRIFGECP